MPATLEAKPAPHATEQDGEFVVYRDVPVWKEHWNSRDFETPFYFGKKELEKVCQRCNDRIEDTDDYSVAVLRHTDDNPDAPVVGFAGPFRMGTVGKKNPVAAILADFRFFKEDMPRVKRHPRLSVEYWFNEKQPDGGYLDPISLLGAETPELDLGIRYSRRAHEGMRVARYSRKVRYQATVPAGSNTFIPGMVSDEDDDKTTYIKGDAMFSEEQLAQIVEAISPVIDGKIAQALPGGTPEPEGDELEMSPYAKMCKYMADGDETGADELLGSLDEDSKAQFSKELDEDDDTDRATSIRAKLDTGHEPASVAAYRRQADNERKNAARYRKERDEVKARYAKLEKEHGELKGEVEVLRDETRKAARYKKLREKLDEGYVFELEDEFEETRDLNDEQFERHVDKTVSRYQKVPLSPLPREETPQRQPPADVDKDQEKKARYSKRAVDLVQRARDNGDELSYKAALKQAEQEDTGKTAA